MRERDPTESEMKSFATKKMHSHHLLSDPGRENLQLTWARLGTRVNSPPWSATSGIVYQSFCSFFYSLTLFSVVDHHHDSSSFSSSSLLCVYSPIHSSTIFFISIIWILSSSPSWLATYLHLLDHHQLTAASILNRLFILLAHPNHLSHLRPLSLLFRCASSYLWSHFCR